MNMTSQVKLENKFPPKLIILLVFYLGLYTLIHEIIWARKLTFIFGNLTIITGLVVTTLFFGFALGNKIFGTAIDNTKSLFSLYGITNGLLAISALISFFIIDHINPPPISVSNLLYYLYASTNIFLILIIPSILMGGMIPLIFKIYEQNMEEVGVNTSFIYAVYTLGGGFGCLVFARTLYLILGMQKTVFGLFVITFSISILLFSILFLKHKRITICSLKDFRFKKEHFVLPGDTSLLTTLRIVSFFSGFLVMGYEMIWLRYVDQHLISYKTIKTLGTVLGVFVFGLGIGAYASYWLCNKRKDIKITYLLPVVQLLLFSSLGTVYVINYILRPESAIPLLGQNIQFALSLFITCLLGMLFPLVLRYGISSWKILGTRFASFYVSSTLGSIIGTLTTSFILLPQFGLEGSFLILFIVLIVFTLFSNSMFKIVPRKLSLYVTLICVLFISLCVVKMRYKSIPNIYYPRLKQYTNFEGIQWFTEDDRASIAVIKLGDRDLTSIYNQGIFLLVDNCIGAGTMQFLLEAHYLAGFIPQYLLNNYRNAVTIGLGTGITTKVLSLAPSIDKLRCIEISKGVQLASKTNFNEFNQGIFDGKDKRINVHLMDGVNFMLRTDEMFDLIQVDSFTVEHLASSDFFTRDFYQICEKHLSSDGIILQWVMTTRRQEYIFKNLLATFRSVFPFATVWSSPSGHIYFIGSKEKDSLKSPDNFRNWLTTFLTKKSHRDVIQKINIERLSLASILSVDEVNKYLEDYHESLNTHDKPIYSTSFQSGQSIEEAFHLN